MAKVCDCPYGGKDRGKEGRISIEIEDHEEGCWVLARLKRMTFEYILVVDSSNGSFTGLTSTRKYIDLGGWPE